MTWSENFEDGAAAEFGFESEVNGSVQILNAVGRSASKGLRLDGTADLPYSSGWTHAGTVLSEEATASLSFWVRVTTLDFDPTNPANGADVGLFLWIGGLVSVTFMRRSTGPLVQINDGDLGSVPEAPFVIGDWMQMQVLWSPAGVDTTLRDAGGSVIVSNTTTTVDPGPRTLDLTTQYSTGWISGGSEEPGSIPVTVTAEADDFSYSGTASLPDWAAPGTGGGSGRSIAYGYQLFPRVPATKPQVYVDGLPMDSIAPWTGLRTTTRLNGTWQISWTMLRHPRKPLKRHPALHVGAPVEVRFGPCVLEVGSLTEPDWDSGELVALGAPREAEGALSLTAGGILTTKPNAAIDAAIARGALNWTRGSNFGNTPIGSADGNGSLNSVARLLDARAEDADNPALWRVDRQRIAWSYDTNENDPDWFITPGAGELGTASDERVDRVFVRFLDSTSSGDLATASWPATTPAGGIERGADITNRGAITPAKAESIAHGVWRKMQRQSGWANGINVNRSQVTNKGGQVANLALIRAGHAMRLLGVADPRGLAHHLDVVIGETEYDWTEQTIQLNPDGLADRTFESVLEDENPGATPL